MIHIEPQLEGVIYKGPIGYPCWVDQIHLHHHRNRAATPITIKMEPGVFDDVGGDVSGDHVRIVMIQATSTDVELINPPPAVRVLFTITYERTWLQRLLGRGATVVQKWRAVELESIKWHNDLNRS